MSTFHHPYLTNAQVEEMETMGYLELDDLLMTQIINWAEDPSQEVNNTNN